MQVKGHEEVCAINEDGPCTYGAEKVLEDVLQEEAAEFLED